MGPAGGLLKHKLAAIVTVSAGGALLVFSILYISPWGGFETGGVDVDWPFSNVKIFSLIAGILIAGAGALGYFPQTKQYLGVGSVFHTAVEASARHQVVGSDSHRSRAWPAAAAVVTDS